MLLSVLFVCFLIHSVKTDASILSSAGDVVVVGMFEVFEPEVTKCGENIRLNSVMYAEAVRWYFQKLNENDELPVKIGFEAYKTCNLDTLAAEEAMKLVNRILEPSGQQKLIMGVIGPEYSSESMAVSRVLSAVVGGDRLMQVGFSATSTSLRDSQKYPNFLSVVADDGVQTEAMVQSMQQLGWNRIAIVYEDNVLGREASVALTQRAGDVGICVAMISSVDVKHGVSVAQVDEIINDIIYGTSERSAINGYVFFGSASTAKVLFQAIKRSDIQSAPLVLLSESIELDTNAFNDATGNVLSKTQGSLAVGPPYRAIDEFRDHWISIFTNGSVYASAVAENPWLQHVAENVNASCAAQACSRSDFIQQMFKSQPLYAQYAIFAAHAMVVGVKEVQRQHCGQTSGVCTAMTSAFRPGQVLESLGGKVLNFATDFNFKLASLETPAVSLILGGNNNSLRTNPDYQLFNFRKTVDQDFDFVKIGDLNGDALTLNTDNLRDYPDGIAEASWPDVRKAQCGDKQKCTECVPDDLPNGYILVPGDIYVIGLVPVYEYSATVECDTLRTINGYQLVEALKFAVEKVNQKTGIFSNIFKNAKVGLIVLNTCNNQIVAQRKVYNLVKNGLTLANGEHIDLKNKIIGFTGDVGSSISIAIAETLTRLKYVQVSYASTSPRLSDRGAYPYFLRVVTPDDAQANVMIDIVKKLGGNYIQVLYSKGAYGEDGLAKVLEAAEEHGVCVISKIEVDDENPNYYSYYEQLRKTPQAKIVLAFLRSHVVKPAMTVITGQMEPGEFIFIGSEAWAKNQDILNADEDQSLLGSFSVVLELAHNAELQTHMTSLEPVKFTENPWLKMYLETKLNCYYPDSFDKSRPHACEDVLDFKADPNFSLDLWVTAAYNSMASLLIGAGNHLRAECGEVATLCDGYTNNIDGLLTTLRAGRLDLYGLGTRMRVFDDNGDGNVGYILYNIQKDTVNPQELVYTRVGQYPLQGNPTFSTESAVSPVTGDVTSVCPSEQACSNCYRRPSVTETQTQKTEEQSPITIVLGALLGLTVLVIIVLIVIIVKKVCKAKEEKGDDDYDGIGASRKEDPYLNPIASHRERAPADGANLHALSVFKGEDSGYVRGEDIQLDVRN